MIRIKSILVFAALLAVSIAQANQAQPVPIQEDESFNPQLTFSGVGIGTLGYARTADLAGQGTINFSDTSMSIGSAQKLSQLGGIGSFGLGGLTTDQANRGTSQGTNFFLHQAFLNLQTEKYEFLVGRSDNEIAHLVDFPTLRGDDLITLTNPLNPFSNGANVEEHRYANVASVTFNQGLTYFENIHAQHLIDSAALGTGSSINSVGGTFHYMSAPGLEAFSAVPFWGAGVEHLFLTPAAPNGLNQVFAGGVVNLNTSVTNRFDLRAQDVFSFGSDLAKFQTITDSYQADSNSLALALRYLNTPFGSPGYQLSLTAAYKNYLKVADANSVGVALTGVKRLGEGFEAVAQYQELWRQSSLSVAQSNGVGAEQIYEIGFVFGFETSLNQHISPRRTLLNQQHHYIIPQ